MSEARSAVVGIDTAFPDIQAALNTLPAALGTDGTPKTYVLIFQNDKELRPTGGFWTAYALVTFKNGQLIDVKSNDMYNLDAQIGLRNHPAPPAFFKGFLDVDYFYARDANISPDFVVSAQKFQDFWKLAGNAPVAGIWAMDTYVLQELLSVLGPIKTGGYDQPFDQNNVVERMETYANVLLKEQAGRKDLIGELMNSIMGKAFTASQKDYPKLISAAVKLLAQKHILLSFNNSGVQAIVSKYNLSGQVIPYIGDYLYVNDGNFGGMKANWFVTEQISKTTTVDNGKLHSVVTINYQNPGAYNVNWNTGYKDIVRVYVPQGSKLLSSSGSVTPVTAADELGKAYFLASVLVKPDGGTASLTFTYTLPSTISSTGAYKLLIQKQPGTGATPVTVSTNGKTQKVTLETDQEITANL
ncbi:MAG: DUF4012 domain-containing protein [candidate division WWE3 bacterium]|nr:DUF4012 domain-containing protein [candidate division WWE3 bacterium]